ncbi:MAG: restriction endonuclease [Sulfurospirillaceae bacterium]|nr:restriction endonuclease [Sulfurospirillaceae bacterium]
MKTYIFWLLLIGIITIIIKADKSIRKDMKQKNKEKKEIPLHVNQNIQNMEKQFFNHQKNIPKPRTTYQENKKRGNDYEEFVGAYYERQGYQITYHGFERGRKDGGIDLIAENEYETLLIQCKAWQKAIVKQKHIKEFIGNCTIFLENNPQIATKIKRVFVTSSEAEDRALTKYLQENKNKIEFIIMPF